MNITAPTVHLNGTGYKDLWSGYEAAYEAVRAAQDALRKIEFNARDYYVQGNEAYSKARDHRTEQFIKLVDIEEYLLQHLLSLQEQER
jgi:hypothetical protein